MYGKQKYVSQDLTCIGINVRVGLPIFICIYLLGQGNDLICFNIYVKRVRKWCPFKTTVSHPKSVTQLDSLSCTIDIFHKLNPHNSTFSFM